LAGRSLQLAIGSGSNVAGTMQAGANRLGDLVIDSTGAFDNSDDQDLPQVGDVVIATKDVSVRQGPIFRRGPDPLLQLARLSQLGAIETRKCLKISKRV